MLRTFQHWLKMQSINSSEMLKGIKHLPPFSTGQFDQAERSQATFSNQKHTYKLDSHALWIAIINE